MEPATPVPGDGRHGTLPGRNTKRGAALSGTRARSCGRSPSGPGQASPSVVLPGDWVHPRPALRSLIERDGSGRRGGSATETPLRQTRPARAPATRMPKTSPSARSKTISMGTRESEQPMMATFGYDCQISARRCMALISGRED
eukprot:scaffold9757_cov104-Isochrysis_galbana.AAC.1